MIDFCKIRTDRLRQLSKRGLYKVFWAQAVTTPYAQRWKDPTKGPLVAKFLERLATLHDLVDHNRLMIRPSWNSIQSPRKLKRQRELVTEAERAIWDAQAQAGCNLGKELVARDAVLERRYGEANRIRRTKRRAGLRKRK